MTITINETEYTLTGKYEKIDDDSIHIETEAGVFLLHPSECGYKTTDEFIKAIFNKEGIEVIFE